MREHLQHILVGDARAELARLRDNSIHCVVTSPPYYGLRDYKTKGQLGVEPTPDIYVQNLVEVFREIKRVLRHNGTCWLNLGDSYNNFRVSKGPGQAVHGRDKLNGKPAPDSGRRGWRGLKEKDLVGIPWRVAFALQQDGWYLRQDIIWHKPNPMPESVTDRCTKAHEYLFLLTKSEKYYFDNKAIKEDAVNGATRNRRSVWTIEARSFRGVHFAVFPSALVQPCVLAGSPIGGVVLDPFSGSGTVGVVCKQLRRRFVGIDINHAYVKMAQRRIDQCVVSPSS